MRKYELILLILVTVLSFVSATILWAQQAKDSNSHSSSVIEKKTSDSKVLTKTSIAPQIMNYQGYLTDQSGIPLVGSILARLSIWNLPEGGSELWFEEMLLEVAQGYFTAELGASNPIPSSLFNGSDRWIELKLGEEVLSPRKRIVSVANAFYATNADQLNTHQINDFYIRSQADDNQQNNIDASKLGGEPAESFMTIKQIEEGYVNVDESNSVTSDMITDGSIQTQDLSFTMGLGDITAVNAGTGLTGGALGGDATLSLNPEYLSGQAYDERFLKKNERNSINSMMITDESITSSDIQNGSIQQADLNFNIGAITSIITGSGVAGGGTSGDVNVYLEQSYQTGTVYDARFVNENQPNSISSSMITNGTIQQQDVGFPIGDITGISAGSGLSGGGNSGDVTLSLSSPYANGEAFNGVFVNEGQTNAITSGMIQDGQVGEKDLASGVVSGNHVKNPLLIDKMYSSGATVSVINRSTNSSSSAISAQGYVGIRGNGTNSGVYGEGATGVEGKGTQFGVRAESTSGWALWVQGRAFCSNGDWGDLAEYVYGSENIESGDVVVIDASSKCTVRKCFKPNDTSVAGVISTKPSFTVGHLVEAEDGYPLALAGIVLCKATTNNGAIAPGDLLTTSELPGHAMKATEPTIGAILGKALEPLDSGNGKLRVLVTLR